MSTKIYNAYITDKNLSELLEEYKKLVPEVEKLSDKLYYKTFTEQLVFKLDKEENTDINKIINEKLNKILEKLNESKLKNIRDVDYDFSSSCVCFPIENKTLIIYYAENNEILNLLTDNIYLKDYHYQNSTDKPNDVLENDWIERKLNWDLVLNNGIPAHNGFVFTFSFQELEYLVKKRLNEFIPDNEKRAEKLCWYNYSKNATSVSDIMNKLDSFNEFKNTEEYKEGIKIYIESLKMYEFDKI